MVPFAESALQLTATPVLDWLVELLSSWIRDCLIEQIFSWVRSWFISGCALETLLLLTGPAEHFSTPSYLLATCLNAVYLFASTSWLLYLALAAACWPLVAITCVAQYAAVSSFTRARLRRLLKLVHLYRDKVAFFHLPSLVIDTNLDGLVTVRGATVSLLDASVELHGIEIGLDLGSGHELAIHSDAVTIKLFRSVTIEEVYGVHWYDEETRDHEHNSCMREHRVDSHRDGYVDDLPKSKEDTAEDRLFPDRTSPTSQDGDLGKDLRPHTSPARLPSRGDIQAEDRYDLVLHQLHTTNRLYQSRARVKVAQLAHANHDREHVDTRAAICADLRNTRPAMSPSSTHITLSKLISLLEPISRLIKRTPYVLRLLLWLTSQCHPITCLSICFSASGQYLGNVLTQKLFRKYAETNEQIAELSQEVSRWLADADLYVDFANLRGRASVPLRTTDLIGTDIRSADIVITRIGAGDEAQAQVQVHNNQDQNQNQETTGRVARLSGADTAFSIPICLLPSHSYLAPPPPSPESSEQENGVPVAFSVRVKLPAFFDDTFLGFAATFFKGFQFVDMEEDGDGVEGEGEDKKDTDLHPSRYSASSSSSSISIRSTEHHNHPHLQSLRAKLSHTNSKLTSALHLHPNNPKHDHQPILEKPMVRHPKKTIQKAVKKTAVEKIDGAWCAKWSNKILKKLEGVEGDLGWSGEVGVQVAR